MLLVAPNLTIDRRVFVHELVPGTVGRSVRTEALPGGKPVDVARALRAHEVSPVLVALVPGASGRDAVDRLREEGLEVVAVECEGSIRDTVILYEDSGRVTVINGQGPHIDARQWATLLDEVDRRARDHEVVVCSGSFPPGAPEDALAQLTVAVHAHGGQILLDAGPAWLAPALAAHPDLVSPNLGEAEQLLGVGGSHEPVDVGADAEHRAVAAAAALVAAGARAAIVSAGPSGVAVADREGAERVPAVPVEVVNPIGAGDALLAGVAARRAAGDGWLDAARWGVATAAAAITQWVPGAAPRELTRQLHQRVVTGSRA